MGNYEGKIIELNKKLLTNKYTHEYTNKYTSKIKIKTTKKAHYRGFF